MSGFGGRTGRAGQTPRLSQRSFSNGRWSWIGATRFLALVAVLLAFLAASAAPALAWDDDDDDYYGGTMNKIQGRCPGTIYKSTRLIGDIVAQPGDPDPCISFGNHNIRLDMDGYFINVSTAAIAVPMMPAVPIEIRAIATNGFSHSRIEGKGGFILTNYKNPSTTTDSPGFVTCKTDGGASPCAIHVKGGTNNQVRDVFVRNVQQGATWGPVTPEMMEMGVSPTVIGAGVPVCPGQMDRGGIGIMLQNTTRSKVSDNWVECFNFGIYLTNADGGSDGDGFVTHNLIKDNSNSLFSSSGLVFNVSSGWFVHRNVLTGNGANPSAPADANILVFAGSNKNRFEQNKTDNNFGAGTFVDAGAIKNLFYRNHVTWNSGGLPNTDPTKQSFTGGWDLGDANAPAVNAYKFNTCRFSAGPGVPVSQCNPAIN